MKMKSAIDASRAYELPERHDPLYLFFDNDFLLGTGGRSDVSIFWRGG